MNPRFGFAALFVLAACGASNPSATEPSPGGAVVAAPTTGASQRPAPQPAPTANTSVANSADDQCNADGDCVPVEMACCDHCNGGSLAAFNRAHADKHKRTGCEEVSCTMRGCGAARATCVDHHCKASVEKIGPGL